MIFVPVLFCLIPTIAAINSTTAAIANSSYAHCGGNKTYVSCTYKCTGVMCPKESSLLSTVCILPPNCKGGCGCKPKYKYNDRGACILASDCPQIPCNDNETYVYCAFNCPDKYCPVDDQPLPACVPPRICRSGCVCKNYYKLNILRQCILYSDCPQINCYRQNEEFNSCPSNCVSDTCEDADTTQSMCKNLTCTPKCTCKKNHFRNEDGLCVPALECTSICKDSNAEWKECKDNCPGTCKNTNPVCPFNKCVAGCQCKDGYMLSKPNGKCVEIATCGDYSNCEVNQTFVACTLKCLQGMCPDSSQTILPCNPPKNCPGGCGCKPNYRYNADGECILHSDCHTGDL
ncbi:von Willebrand factor-like isoform X2 [Choristoneura fumiferana]|uniref:von Willebrand factor-like isoform X2 n=1 Tax=Choristoneura fumiferana TaxID=7141 RepID=UPI003D15B448